MKDNTQCFATPPHEHQTRNRDLLLLQHHSTSLFEKSPKYCFAKLYNKLPSSIRHLENTNTFKKKVKALLSEMACYSLQEYLDS